MEIEEETIILRTKNGKLVAEERVPTNYVFEGMSDLWKYAEYIQEMDLEDEFNSWYDGDCTCWDDVIPMDILSLSTQSDIIWDFIQRNKLEEEYKEWEETYEKRKINRD